MAVAGLMLLIAGRVAVASAQDGGDFAIDWWTIDGGGGTSSGGQFALRGAIGQPDAYRSGGESFVVQGGFFAGAFAVDSPYDFEGVIPGVAKQND